jgi:hypothetical protein
MDTFTTITKDTLAGVAGGMNIDDLPESENIEDRRGETWWQSLKRWWQTPKPKPWPGPPNPEEENNQMSIDLGIRDLDTLLERLRKR